MWHLFFVQYISNVMRKHVLMSSITKTTMHNHIMVAEGLKLNGLLNYKILIVP